MKEERQQKKMEMEKEKLQKIYRLKTTAIAT